MITSIKSPFLEYKMTILRNKKTSNSLFRQTMNEASYLIAADLKQQLILVSKFNCTNYYLNNQFQL